jgi:hypothetical protein
MRWLRLALFVLIDLICYGWFLSLRDLARYVHD